MNNRFLQDEYEVLHVFGNLNRGGAETLILNIQENTESLIKFNYLVHGNITGSLESKVINLGSQIFRVQRFNGLNYFGYVNELKNVLGKLNKKTIIHIHIRSVSQIIYKVGNALGFPTVIHSHSTSNGDGLLGYVKTKLQYSGDSQAVNVACSEDSGKWMFGENKFTILRNNIPFNKYIFSEGNRSKIRHELDVNDSFVIGHVGTYIPVKNHKFIIKLAQALKLHNLNLKFILLGNGVLNQNLNNEIKLKELSEYIIQVGSVNNVNEYYSAFDCFILPSLYEGFPMVTIESQVNGLKLLVSSGVDKSIDILGNVDFLDLDVELWTKQIKRLMSSESRIMPQNRLRNPMVTDFNTANCKDVLERIYIQAIKNLER